MNMRSCSLLCLALAACAAPRDLDEPEDPQQLAEMLSSGDPSRREEALQRMVRRGLVAPAGSADTDAMAERVLGALGEREPEPLVWRAWHAVRLGSLAREWSGVSAALARQNFRLVEIYEPHERAKFVRFLAKIGAYVDGAGTPHDLFFWIQASRKGEERWTVREVYVGLHATFDAPFKQVAQGDRYRAGSVLGQFLELSESKKMAAVYPILEEIELTYGRIRTREGEAVPAGFHVNAGFVLGAGGQGGGRGMAATSESGLDPRETPGGRLLREGFVPASTLGPLVVRGGSFWGAGGLKPSDD